MKCFTNLDWPIWLLIALLCVCGCRPTPEYALRKIEYITSFDKEIDLTEDCMSEVSLQADGINNIKVFGPYIIASTYNPEGYLAVFENRPPYRLLGSYFRNGNGPNELITSVLASSLDFKKDSQGNLYALFDNRAGKIIRFDIDLSVINQQTVAKQVGESKRTSFVTIDLGDEGVFHKDLSPERDRQTRYIEKDGEQVITKSMEKLNSAVIANKTDDGTRFNVLSGSVCYDPNSKRFAETPGQINAIHIYSLDDSFSKTFCFGKELYDINELADRDDEDRPRTSRSTRQYDDYIGVLYKGVTPREDRPDFVPDIILLSWDGQKNAIIHLLKPVQSFDFDFEKKVLYTFDQHNEKMYVYDISSHQL